MLNNPNEVGNMDIWMTTLQRDLLRLNNVAPNRSGCSLEVGGSIPYNTAKQKLSIAFHQTVGKLEQLTFLL